MIRQDKLYFLVHAMKYFNISMPNDNLTMPISIIRSILSNGSLDKEADRSLSNLLKKYSTTEEIFLGSFDDILSSITPLDLSHDKSKIVVDFLVWCDNNFTDFNIDIINDWTNDEIINNMVLIKGISISTIYMIMCLSLNRDIFPVNDNIIRVLKRFGVIDKVESSEQLSIDLSPFVPIGRHKMFYVKLNDFGVNICKENNPLCSSCSFDAHCSFYRSHSISYN